MRTVRKSSERGHFNFGWLNTYHTFSFGDYFDRNHMGFRALRVINEDYVNANQGFGTHPHRDMEIITYVVSGALEHKDSMGNGSIIEAGDVQYMSAGSGVTHSEFNPKNEPVHLLQIWIVPNQKGLVPRYNQKKITKESKTDQLKLIIASEASKPSVTGDTIFIRQDAKIYASLLKPGKELGYSLESNHHAWIQLISGKLNCNDTILEPGDGLAISQESTLRFTSEAPNTEFLLFDLT